MERRVKVELFEQIRTEYEFGADRLSCERCYARRRTTPAIPRHHKAVDKWRFREGDNETKILVKLLQKRRYTLGTSRFRPHAIGPISAGRARGFHPCSNSASTSWP